MPRPKRVKRTARVSRQPSATAFPANLAHRAAASAMRLRPPRLLAYIDAVGRYGSIRKAADALNVAASALNRGTVEAKPLIQSYDKEAWPRDFYLALRASSDCHRGL